MKRQLSLYNTLTRQADLFAPLNPPLVMMYTCGPTVYGPGHLGHARSYTNFDLLKRVLVVLGYQVKHILNITDIHDDMIKKAKEEKISIFELADRYTPLFFRDLTALNILAADTNPKVTEVIPEIIEMVQTLIDKGFAYVEKDGSVYFDVSSYPDYGKLSGIKLEKALSGSRVETDKYEREEASDFALWKGYREGEPSWESPWGRGRPGWHIECSVMAKKFLGKTIDIHAGALDLKFPHHENEIAQSQAANAAPFSRWWVHGGLLKVEGQKMAKSLGNYVELAEVIARGYPPMALRYLFLTTSYRHELNFTWDGLKAAWAALSKLYLAIEAWRKAASGEGEPVHEYVERFTDLIVDDLNLPQALGLLWKLVKDTGYSAEAKLATVKQFDRVFGLDLGRLVLAEAPFLVFDLANKREKLREKKKWPEADAVRQEIEELGYLVEDTPQGPKIKPK